ncbi:hypothetical protein C5Y96_17780 [Blastopirellula marina]|uniref:Uncharacterized protein n=1 Tax=Blastopirellula marina TaxID=124 RepID=A0A2S8F5F9_9BACT|nr:MULTISPECIES: hypothetical protein [Pirellulaceae]PQO27391.1 hypothetical protein C5Y96_17780 [Blastopirellula marina]RCS47928.1 hypothetical protein DTL36_17805 [Bremerella cremea]
MTDEQLYTAGNLEALKARYTPCLVDWATTKATPEVVERIIKRTWAAIERNTLPDGRPFKVWLFLIAAEIVKEIAPHTPETLTVIGAMVATGNTHFEGDIVEVAQFLEGYHREEEPYHPALASINWERVDWFDVAEAVGA